MSETCAKPDSGAHAAQSLNSAICRTETPVQDALADVDAPIPFVPTDLGAKHDHGKLRYDLLPFAALEAVVGVLEFGARKYEADGWRHVPDSRRRYFAASMRHLMAWWRGEALDPESGEHHLAHVACCVLFLLDAEAPQ